MYGIVITAEEFSDKCRVLTFLYLMPTPYNVIVVNRHDNARL